MFMLWHFSKKIYIVYKHNIKCKSIYLSAANCINWEEKALYNMSNKNSCIDARQELAELVKRKAEIGVCWNFRPK